MHLRRRLVMLALALAMLPRLASIAAAAPTPELKCLAARYKAAGKYQLCEQTVIATLVLQGLNPDNKFQPSLSKCRIKYTATWAKLQKAFRNTGSACDGPRFTNPLNGTVTDNLTLLQWEQKTDDGTIHDKDDVYVWSLGLEGAANGPVFTTFLEGLNQDPACFAGHCDWRLPSVYELQTTLFPEPYPCVTLPCIDQTIFGPTPVHYYWTATKSPPSPTLGWVISTGGGVVLGFGVNTGNFAIRAVRGGL